MPCDRWKFRMQAGAAQFVDDIKDDDDVLIVDSMLDVSLLVALLRNRSPKILVYMHENQLTTPFTHQDRDRQHQTHWH